MQASLIDTLTNNPQAIVGALLGWLVLIYTGMFRALGGVFGRITTPLVVGYWVYHRADDPNKINVTLNILQDGKLEIDTIVADRTLKDIYTNMFVVQMLKSAAGRTTKENPVVSFKLRKRTKAWFGLSPRTDRHLYDAAYNPLISQISEKMENIFAFMKAVGVPMREYRFVIALTYEKGIPNRDQHFRCMMIWEKDLETLPERCPDVDHPQYHTRFRTLLCIAESYRRHPERFGIIKLWLPEMWAPGSAPGSAREIARARPEPVS